MSYITTDYEQSIARITLNRPEKLNAFNNEMINALKAAVLAAELTPSIRFIVLAANGKHFSAGADLNWMQSNIGKSEAENETDAKQLADLLQTLTHCKLPIICKVQGRSFGGALGLIACSDIVVASDVATFCFSEVKLGIIPATIAPYILRKIGLSRAMQYILSGNVFDAEKAHEFGLIHHIKPSVELDVETDKICQFLLKNGPHAMMAAKALLNQLQPIDEKIAVLTAKSLAKIRISSEGQEGLKAFLEKRKPNWLEVNV
ncbi:MAG: hypothetical protein A3F17_05995 [Gammaproteobacteria bacterium RIFCSPHIGHO2_12_FULL_41_15]|nr:MAG: hypothetical protein A3F17_05995 [Gammaproteobacteria bacterium RIFCSPHIGHO2_12_FULL_41_15]